MKVVSTKGGDWWYVLCTKGGGVSLLTDNEKGIDYGEYGNRYERVE